MQIGYSADSSIKEHEHRCQAGRAAKVAPHMHFYLNTLVTMNKQSVLANLSNKEQIVQLLLQQLAQSGFTVHEPDDDADAHIALVALQIACTNITLVVVAADDTPALSLEAHYVTCVVCVSNKSGLFLYFRRRLELIVASRYSCRNSVLHSC